MNADATRLTLSPLFFEQELQVGMGNLERLIEQHGKDAAPTTPSCSTKGSLRHLCRQRAWLQEARDRLTPPSERSSRR